MFIVYKYRPKVWFLSSFSCCKNWTRLAHATAIPPKFYGSTHGHVVVGSIVPIFVQLGGMRVISMSLMWSVHDPQVHEYTAWSHTHIQCEGADTYTVMKIIITDVSYPGKTVTNVDTTRTPRPHLSKKYMRGCLIHTYTLAHTHACAHQSCNL